MSWERRTIVQLRDRFRDLVHPLGILELRVSKATVKLRYIDPEGLGRRGAFRVHPRLPALQIWPDEDEGYEFIRSMARSDEAIIRQIEHIKRVRDAEESLMRARAKGEPPRREDWQVAQEARIQRTKQMQPMDEDVEGRIVMLKEIEDAVRIGRDDILRRSRTLPREPIEVRLDPKAPVRFRQKIQIRLFVQFE